MLDKDNEIDKKAIEEITKAATSMTGTNFALAMRNPDGTVTVYERPNQPCQGGEMRKYGSSHKDSTRPKDRRPGDLRMPFPEGTPEAVAVHLNDRYLGYGSQRREDYDFWVESVYGVDSPYLRGFGTPDDVVKIRDEKSNIIGIIFTDTEVDPTVLVNSLQFLRSGGNGTLLKILIDIGFSMKEALCISMLGFHHGVFTGGKMHPGTTYSYYFSTNASLRRIFEADPFDLSGGTFRNRFDYNRPDVQDLFKAREGEIVTNLATAFNEEFKNETGKVLYSNKNYAYNYEDCDAKLFKTVMDRIFKRGYYDTKGLIVDEKKEAA